jgi:hypothetical protein
MSASHLLGLQGPQQTPALKKKEKGIEESWQMTMKSLITSPFVQL